MRSRLFDSEKLRNFTAGLNPASWHLFSETIRDLQICIPYYWSGWRDAWNYRVVPATVFIFFANLLPAIAFAQDLFDRTDSAYGLNEALLSSAIGGVVWGLFSGQPLCIVGVTGPITIFNYTIFDIVVPLGIPYFPFIAWVYIWGFILHLIITAFNGVKYMRYITMFSCDIFESFINVIYIQKGIQILTRQFEYVKDGNAAGAYFSIVTALALFIFGITFHGIGTYSPLFPKVVRKFILDYSLPLCVVFFTGLTFFPGRISELVIERLPTTQAFQPTTSLYGRDHGWFIHFWNISVGDVFLALPFAILLTAIFYFDHNISSIMSLSADFKFEKPAGFHWDFLLLGIVLFVSGILGIPAPNGLIPQAPLHTISLKKHEGKSEPSGVVEQRASNFIQGLATLGLMTGPLLTVLGLVPQGVLAGLFFLMGVPGLLESEIVRRIFLLLSDTTELSTLDPLLTIKKSVLVKFLALSLIGVGAEIAITETIAAVGFPGVLFIFMALGAGLGRFFKEPDLKLLDGPAADQFVLSALDRGSHYSESSSSAVSC